MTLRRISAVRFAQGSEPSNVLQGMQQALLLPAVKGKGPGLDTSTIVCNPEAAGYKQGSISVVS
jgi:hypothetical protein